MFTRTHRIGRHVYTEALESYRDPDTGRPRHRCVARWRAEHSFAEALGRTHWEVEQATESVAFWQSILDRTVRPKFSKQIKRAPGNLKLWRRRLDAARTHLAALTAARAAGLFADDAEIEQAAQTEAHRRATVTAQASAMFQPRPVPDLAGLAQRVRQLAAQNDPDALRAEIAEIATALSR